MKALSLKQPWANLIWCGKKTIETRKWATSYRGELLICTSKVVDYNNLGLTYMFGVDDEPKGKAICVVELFDCKPMVEDDIEKACCLVYPKAHSFFLRNIRPIKPFPVKGQLNIFNIDVKPGEIVYL